MKKLIIALLVILLTAGSAMAAGTVTVTTDKYSADVDIVTFAWTADASDGSVPATASTSKYPTRNSIGCIYFVVTDPGSTAPTDDYDITITDSTGVDLMGGELADRDTANSEQAAPKIGSVYGCRIVEGTFTLNITGNSVNSATGTVKVYIAY